MTTDATNLASRNAGVLVDALPWIQNYTGDTVVIKYGGNAMVDENLRISVMQDILFLHAVGIKVVIVHGGGPHISSMLDTLGIESEFKNGLRITTPETMDVVRMVLTGKVSRELVGLINAHSFHSTGLAIGMSGEDGGLFKARHKTTQDSQQNTIDLGQVGDIVEVNPCIINDLLVSNHIPVISPVAPNIDDPKEVLNINADIAASKLALALKARKLIILTDVNGLYANYPDPASLISEIGANRLKEMVPDLKSGMIPKVSACLDAVNSGVAGAHIINGTVQHSILTEVFTQRGIGTYVTAGDHYVLEQELNDNGGVNG